MKQRQDIRIHGHRGWRGLYPENTVIGFVEAVKLGVDVLEMDVVLSAENELIVSHDPFMHHEICRKPDGSAITPEEEENHNMYRMTIQEIKKYQVGVEKHARFPKQKQISTYKPTFQEVVDVVNPLLSEEQRKTIHWNIEIKSRPEWDGHFHPAPDIYAAIAYEDLKKTGVLEFAVIQSFDPRILRALHTIDPSLKLVYLNEDANFEFAHIESILGFKPYGYSPHFAFVTEDLVKNCDQKNIQLITWTVNEEKDIREMLSMGVREIISDYPERVMKILEGR